MSKLDSRPRYSAGKGKSHHVMSHNFKFTAAAGHLNPIDHDILLPGDKIVYRPNFRVTCAQPMLAPAMCDIDFHVDTFFVPMTMLYTPFEAAIYGTNEIYSSSWLEANQYNPMNTLPYINGQTLMRQMATSVKTWPVTRRIPETIGQSWVRLATLLGLNPNIGYHLNFTTENQHQPYREHGYMPNFFPYQLLAYEAIYQNYFRLDDYEEFSQRYFNMDNQAGPIQYGFVSTQVRAPWSIRYRPAYSDYFNSVKLSPLLTDTNIYNYDDDGRLGGLLDTLQDRGYQNILAGAGHSLDASISPDINRINGSFIDIFNSSVFQDAESSSDSQYKTESGIFTDQPGQNSVMALRTLFANEKLLMVTDRAKKNYDAQTLAHFGVKVPHDVLHQLTHLSHDVFSLQVNELVSTADTAESGGAPLGEYFGKGYAGKNCKETRFTAPCHGVFMVIFSVAPRYDYVVDFLRKNQVADRLDFFQPEYDALGMQPLYRYELGCPSAYSSVSDSSGSVQVDEDAVPSTAAFNPQGWVYRYSQFKRNIDRATIAFSPDYPNTYSSWALTRKPFRGVQYGRVSFGDTMIADYNDHRSYERFVVLPSDLDQLFGSSYFYGWKDGTTDDEDWDMNLSLVFARDPFVVNAHLGYDKFSIMSQFSMPKLM